MGSEGDGGGSFAGAGSRPLAAVTSVRPKRVAPRWVRLLSIRTRLLLATAVIALVALVGADIATYASLRSFLYGQVDNGLELSHLPVEQSVTGKGGSSGDESQQAGSGGGEAQAQGPDQCPLFHGTYSVSTGGLAPGTVIEVRSPTGKTTYTCALTELGSSGSSPLVLPATIVGLSAGAGDGEEPVTYFTAEAEDGAAYRVRASVLGSGPDAGGQLIVAVPVTGTVGTLHRLFLLELVVTGGALVVALGLGWSLVRASLHPLRDVERTAEAITAGQLTERVPGDQARTEVGRVARAFNVMIERIQGAFAERDRTEADLRASEERMRRFVADASHELRTPLAAVRAYAELYDRGAAERPEDLRRLITGIQRESGRMSRLVEDLLLLAHLDEGGAVHPEPVDLVAVAADAVTTARAVGPQWPVRLRATGPVEAEADPLRVRQMLDNLIGNVRVHCPPGTTATVTVRGTDDGAELEVSDDGPGLTDEQASRIFERFFRADPSRSRLHVGAGLGLSIVSALVRAHGGAVAVGRSPEGGASFTIRLPARPPAPQGQEPGASAGAGRPAPKFTAGSQPAHRPLRGTGP